MGKKNKFKPAIKPAPKEPMPQEPAGESCESVATPASLFYPRAVQLPRRLAVHGDHATPDGLPVGAVIHYTADGPGVDGTMDSLVSKGYGYHFIIARDGAIFQAAELKNRLYHAGHVTAVLGHNPGWLDDKHNPARQFCGIALDNWGYLKERNGKFYAWPGPWTKKIPAELVRKGSPTALPGQIMPWEAATPEQVSALTDLCIWLIKEHGIAAGNFCGHDEIQRGKSDPGGSLPFTMARFREVLAETAGVHNASANLAHPGSCG